MFRLKQRLLDKEQGAEQSGAGGAEAKGPNENWQDNPQLDDNGNPIEGQQQQPPAQKPEETPPAQAEETPTAEDEITQVDISTPVLKQVETLLQDAGLNASEVAAAVTENGGELTPAIVAALVKKHGEAVTSVIGAQMTGFHKASVAKAEVQNKAIYTQVEKAFDGITTQSGQESFKELSNWAKDNVPADERKLINAELARGGLSATYAINDLVTRFKSSASFTQPAQMEQGDSFAGGKMGAPLSRSEYNAQMRKLEREGHVYGQSSEMAKLDRRREAGHAAGI